MTTALGWWHLLVLSVNIGCVKDNVLKKVANKDFEKEKSESRIIRGSGKGFHLFAKPLLEAMLA